MKLDIQCKMAIERSSLRRRVGRSAARETKSCQDHRQQHADGDAESEIRHARGTIVAGARMASGLLLLVLRGVIEASGSFPDIADYVEQAVAIGWKRIDLRAALQIAGWGFR